VEHSGRAVQARAFAVARNRDSSLQAVGELLDSGLKELALQLSETQRRALLDLAGLVAAWGAHLNLSGHRDQRAILQRLILDAVALERVLPPAAGIADLGSGAGLPGLPLAVLRPGSRVTLIEARERRHFFQRAAIRALGLSNVEARLGRSEQLAPTQHGLVIAQALAKPERALDLMLPWAAPTGLLAIPSVAPPPPLALPESLVEEKSLYYTVPCGGPRRSVRLARRRPTR
jgi:16S rRNA (guanine527-N7)-methyltransferase